MTDRSYSRRGCCALQGGLDNAAEAQDLRGHRKWGSHYSLAETYLSEFRTRKRRSAPQSMKYTAAPDLRMPQCGAGG